MNWPVWSTFERKRNVFPAILSELASPALRWYANRQAPRSVTTPSEWKRILILGDHHLGDALYRIAALSHAKEWFPGAEFHLACAPALAALLANHPLLASVHAVYGKERRSQLCQKHVDDLRGHEFDAVICTSLWRGHEDLKLALHLGIPNRAAFSDKGFSAWVTHPLKRPHGLSYAHAILDQFRQLGQPTAALPAYLTPTVPIEKGCLMAARQRLDHLGFGSGKVLALFSTTRQPVETWSDEDCAKIIQHMMKRTWGTLLLGSADDLPRLQRIGQLSGLMPPVLAGDLNLAELAAIIQLCDAVVCPDSGPRHLAISVGTPVFFFRNLNSDPVETGIYAEGETDLLPAGKRTTSAKEQRAILKSVRAKSLAELLDKG